MIQTQISYLRLQNQHVSHSWFTSPVEMVQWLGAVQAQDYEMAKWAIGLRLPDMDTDLIEKAIDEANIIRTHILRPTWHLIAAQDIYWMLELTAPHVNRLLGTMNRKLELDDKVFKRSNAIIEESLTQHKNLTREELMTKLREKGINTNDLRASHLMMKAELEGIVCNGSRKGKQITYALLSERVPDKKMLNREEGLAELAKRYFTSHGPATLSDFVWWSGLTITDARKGLESAKSVLISEKINEQMYWFSVQDNSTGTKTGHSIHLLPAFDEFLVSYKDRSPSLDYAVSPMIFTANGIFKPIIVIDGQVRGVWKRAINTKNTTIEMDLFYPEFENHRESIQSRFSDFASFIKKELVFV
jgi:hypothetical protein